MLSGAILHKPSSVNRQFSSNKLWHKVVIQHDQVTGVDNVVGKEGPGYSYNPFIDFPVTCTSCETDAYVGQNNILHFAYLQHRPNENNPRSCLTQAVKFSCFIALAKSVHRDNVVRKYICIT
jgi:hypothetical protein